jgi:hypothetical protein
MSDDLELMELVFEMDKSPQCRLEVARRYLKLKRYVERLDAEIFATSSRLRQESQIPTASAVGL